MKILDGKISIITGAGSGIGKETALLFAESGSTTILAGRRIEPLEHVVKQIRSYGGISEAYSVDLEDVDESEKFGKYVLEKYGKVDILVNNAGHSSKIRSIRYVDSKEWESVFKVNVEGVYRLTQSLLESMIENKEGTIITVSSVAAIKPGLMGGAPYSSAKAASANLMGHINSELNNLGIRACTIFPAEVDTPILSKRPLPPDIKARSRMMQPIDIANAILLCAAMPQRTLVQEMILKPTFDRDMTEELIKAQNLRN
ncbi:MAG: 3-oxoacyl-ACP reductase [Chloroflexi bacterium]|nr:3-oxoacyl-ACP reductase [Chloroflexota bacterium]|tara:strand:+ start:285 stop:1058 length:774 start_codon:yes stop_codon:yes gene_type:complete